jgi:hypothetical protein
MYIYMCLYIHVCLRIYIYIYADIKYMFMYYHFMYTYEYAERTTPSTVVFHKDNFKECTIGLSAQETPLMVSGELSCV